MMIPVLIAVSFVVYYLMDLAPGDIISAMAPQDATPEQIEQMKEELERGKEVRIRVAGNTIFIGKCDYSTLTFGLNDKIVDLDKPVTIKYGKKTLAKKRLQRSRDIMEQALHERDDARYAFDAKITVKNPGNPKF